MAVAAGVLFISLTKLFGVSNDWFGWPAMPIGSGLWLKIAACRIEIGIEIVIIEIRSAWGLCIVSIPIPISILISIMVTIFDAPCFVIALPRRPRLLMGNGYINGREREF